MYFLSAVISKLTSPTNSGNSGNFLQADPQDFSETVRQCRRWRAYRPNEQFDIGEQFPCRTFSSSPFLAPIAPSPDFVSSRISKKEKLMYPISPDMDGGACWVESKGRL